MGSAFKGGDVVRGPVARLILVGEGRFRVEKSRAAKRRRCRSLMRLGARRRSPGSGTRWSALRGRREHIDEEAIVQERVRARPRPLASGYPGGGFLEVFWSYIER